MDTERIVLIKSLAKSASQEVVDQLQHYKDVFEINPLLEIIDSDVVTTKFRKIINDHLTERRTILPKEVLWHAKS